MATKNLTILTTVILLTICVGCGGGGSRPSPVAAPVTVFIGDSITRTWFSSTATRINKGIDGNTSDQILARFAEDVIALRPATVHILAGTNDLYPAWCYNATVSPDTIANLTSMIALAQQANVRVVIGTLPPWGDGPQSQAMDTASTLNKVAHNAAVDALNVRILDLSGVTVLDYHTVLARGEQYNPAYTEDGVHPDVLGFQAMTQLLSPVIP